MVVFFLVKSVSLWQHGGTLPTYNSTVHTDFTIYSQFMTEDNILLTVNMLPHKKEKRNI